MATPDSLREFFKDFEKFRENDEYDSKGIFLCSEDCDKKLFSDLRLAMIRNNGVRKSTSLMSLNQPKKKALEKEPTKEKDARRAFAQSQKNEILYQQDNKCAVCHKKLDPRATEFDHKKPWASGGRTITENGRALCADCHKIVTHKDRLKKVDR